MGMVTRTPAVSASPATSAWRRGCPASAPASPGWSVNTACRLRKPARVSPCSIKARPWARCCALATAWRRCSSPVATRSGSTRRCSGCRPAPAVTACPRPPAGPTAWQATPDSASNRATSGKMRTGVHDIRTNQMSSERIRFILDFDSTLVRVETLEVMADLVPDAAKVRAKVRKLTDDAMAGRMHFQDALRERLKLIHMHRDLLTQLGAQLREEVTPSFKRNRVFLAAHAADIYVVSSGFREVILSVAKSLGLRPENVFANTLRFDPDGYIDGCDWQNPLAADGGKVKVVRDLKLDGEVVAVGDGWSDYEIFAAGAARRFYVFTENVQRPEVIQSREARPAPSFDEVLYDCGLKGAVSYPKNRLKVLLLENIHEEAVAAFEREGYTVESLRSSPPPHELVERLQDVAILGIRSKTQLDESLLVNARRLL